MIRKNGVFSFELDNCSKNHCDFAEIIHQKFLARIVLHTKVSKHLGLIFNIEVLSFSPLWGRSYGNEKSCILSNQKSVCPIVYIDFYFKTEKSERKVFVGHYQKKSVFPIVRNSTSGYYSHFEKSAVSLYFQHDFIDLNYIYGTKSF